MDFFEAQDAARKRTGVLIALFGAAVLAIIVVVYAVVHVGMAAPGAGIDLGLLLMVTLGVGATVGIGTAIRTASLRQGGPAVAELLGARRVSPDTDDPEERRLVNVVEEMSIASGTPVPAIYVMDREDGINAFAAGYSTHDAAVAVTRGALRALDRDELQGVIAHEFSHILNGDMRLNIRLIGVLYGILLLAIVGRGIVYAGGRGARGRSREGGGGAAWVALLGVALLLVGYVGVFFGKLIKAAVSRQREYLADSAAVQFTRNPAGLAGALKKIGAQGSRINDHHAEEASHLFFANGVRSTLLGALATHPPLEERIRRLEPGWGGDFAAPPSAPAAIEAHAAAARRHGIAPAAAAGLAAAAPHTPAAAVASVGAPTGEHLAYAAALLDRLPEPLLRAAHDPVDARALVFALVLADAGPESGAAARALGGATLPARIDALLPLVREAGGDARLPLLDLALPTLQRLSPDEARGLAAAVERVVHADGRVRLFEFALIHTLSRRLQGATGEVDRGGRRVRSLQPLRAEVETILSAAAWAGAERDPERAAPAFAAGARRLPSDAGGIRLRDPADVTLPQVDRALTALEHAAPPVQRLLLEACAETMAHDGTVRRAEAELLRAIAEALDCPMPPLLAAR